MRNLAAAAFQLEFATTPADIRWVSQGLTAWIDVSAPSSLQRPPYRFTVKWLRKHSPGSSPDEMDRLEGSMAILAQRVEQWEKGIHQGALKESRQEGQEIGQADVLLLLLENRFGVVSEGHQTLIAQARAEQLSAWLIKMLNETSIDEVPSKHIYIKQEMIHIANRLLYWATKKSSVDLLCRVTHPTLEVMTIPVIDLSTSLVEKMVTLFRLAAFRIRQPSVRADSRVLVRYAYDMHVAFKEGFDYASLPELITKALQRDLAEFGSQHIEFSQSPINELLLGLDEFLCNPRYAVCYQQELAPPIIYTDKPSWQDIIDSMISISVQALEPVRPFFERYQPIGHKGVSALILLRRETAIQKTRRLREVVAAQNTLNEVAKAASQALAEHHKTPKPKGLLSRNLAKEWEKKGERLMSIASSASGSLREFQRLRWSSGVDLKAYADARAEVEQRYPQAVEVLTQWQYSHANNKHKSR